MGPLPRGSRLNKSTVERMPSSHMLHLCWRGKVLAVGIGVPFTHAKRSLLHFLNLQSERKRALPHNQKPRRQPRERHRDLCVGDPLARAGVRVKQANIAVERDPLPLQDFNACDNLRHHLRNEVRPVARAHHRLDLFELPA